MRKIFRALLIDPSARTIEEVRYSGELKAYLGDVWPHFFRVASYGETYDQGVADDLGLRKGGVYAFTINTESPHAGPCLILGATWDGEMCDAGMSLAFAHMHVQWLGRIRPDVRWIATPKGLRAVVTYRPAP